MSVDVSIKDFALAMSITADILDEVLKRKLHSDYAMDRVIRATITEIVTELRNNAIPRTASK